MLCHGTGRVDSRCNICGFAEESGRVLIAEGVMGLRREFATGYPHNMWDCLCGCGEVQEPYIVGYVVDLLT